MTTPKKIFPKYGICIDWETSGAEWGQTRKIVYGKKHQGISFGAVVFDARTLTPIETLYREIQFDGTKWEWSAEAEAIHGLSREYLATNGITQEEAAIDLADLILRYFGPPTQQNYVHFLGHNVYFDVAFTEQLLDPFGLMFNVSHTILDSSCVGFFTVEEYKSDRLFDALGLPPRK